jgi:hypothetical protein
MSTKVMIQAGVATQFKYQLTSWDVNVSEDLDLISERIGKLTFSRQQWAAIRQNHFPPPEWFNDDTDPPFNP